MHASSSKVQQKGKNGLTAPNPMVPIKPLQSALPEKTTVQRPKYAQNIKAESGKKEKSIEVRLDNLLLEDGVSSTSEIEKTVSSKNETSSENKKKPWQNRGRTNNNNNRRFVPRRVEAQKFMEIPETLNYMECVVTATKYLPFSGPQHFLSALYPVKMLVDGHSYNSVEHYYQACKVFTLLGKDAAQTLSTATTPIQVKQEVKKILNGNVKKQMIEKWKLSDSFTVLEHAIYQKFKQNDELRQMLLGTDERLLVQAYKGDNFFAADATAKMTNEWISANDGMVLKVPTEFTSTTFEYFPKVVNGKNILGFLNMKVRTKLRLEETLNEE